MSPRYIYGYTLLEIVVVISILILLSALAIGPFMNLRERQILAGEADNIIALIHSARGKTLAAENNTNYGVHFDSDKVVIFPGNTYVDGDSANTELSLQGLVEISEINLSTGSNLVFSKLTGMSDGTGNITISLVSDLNTFKTIFINESGVASME